MEFRFNSTLFKLYAVVINYVEGINVINFITK